MSKTAADYFYYSCNTIIILQSIKKQIHLDPQSRYKMDSSLAAAIMEAV